MHRYSLRPRRGARTLPEPTTGAHEAELPPLAPAPVTETDAVPTYIAGPFGGHEFEIPPPVEQPARIVGAGASSRIVFPEDRAENSMRHHFFTARPETPLPAPATPQPTPVTAASARMAFCTMGEKYFTLDPESLRRAQTAPLDPSWEPVLRNHGCRCYNSAASNSEFVIIATCSGILCALASACASTTKMRPQSPT
jgi:hypothetical protein